MLTNAVVCLNHWWGYAFSLSRVALDFLVPHSAISAAARQYLYTRVFPWLFFVEFMENLYVDFSTCMQTVEMCKICVKLLITKTLSIYYQTHFKIIFSNKSTFNTLEILYIYLAHAYNACGRCNVFTVSVLPSVHRGGGSRHERFLTQYLPKHEHVLALDPLPLGMSTFLALQHEVCNRY